MVTVAIYNLSVRALEQNLELLLCQARLGGEGKGGGPRGSTGATGAIEAWDSGYLPSSVGIFRYFSSMVAFLELSA